jgi:hypothetical protein
MPAYFTQTELIACISYLVPVVPGWWLYSRMDVPLRLLVITLTVIGLFAAAGYYTGEHYIPNLGMYFASYVLSFYLFSVVFLKLLPTLRARWIIRAAMVLFALFVLARLRYTLMPGHFDSYTPAGLSLAMMIYSVVFFNEQLNLPQITFIYKTPWFWVVTGLLLYYAGSFLILLTTSYLMLRDNNFIRGLWDLLDVLTVIRNLLIALGFVWYKNTSWKTSL